MLQTGHKINFDGTKVIARIELLISKLKDKTRPYQYLFRKGTTRSGNTSSMKYGQ